MNASDTQAASSPAVVRPSWLVAVVMSPLTKVLNQGRLSIAVSAVRRPGNRPKQAGLP
jgi:hypothetical protein